MAMHMNSRVRSEWPLNAYVDDILYSMCNDHAYEFRVRSEWPLDAYVDDMLYSSAMTMHTSMYSRVRNTTQSPVLPVVTGEYYDCTM